MTDDLEKPCHQELSGIEGPLARKLKEQADRIEKLEAGEEEWNRICNRYAARIDKLEAALREITESARLVGDYYHVKIARKALEGKDD